MRRTQGHQPRPGSGHSCTCCDRAREVAQGLPSSLPANAACCGRACRRVLPAAGAGANTKDCGCLSYRIRGGLEHARTRRPAHLPLPLTAPASHLQHRVLGRAQWPDGSPCLQLLPLQSALLQTQIGSHLQLRLYGLPSSPSVPAQVLSGYAAGPGAAHRPVLASPSSLLRSLHAATASREVGFCPGPLRRLWTARRTSLRRDPLRKQRLPSPVPAPVALFPAALSPALRVHFMVSLLTGAQTP